MGTVHDKNAHFFVPPNACHFPTGTWVDLAGAVAGTVVKKKNAADETALVTIPVILPSNGLPRKGSQIVSVDVYYEVLTIALDALSAAFNKVALPADGAAAVVSNPAFSYDTGHDSASERVDVDQHTMTLTLTDPIWLDDGDALFVQLTIDAAAASVFHLLGARLNYVSKW